MSYVKFVQGNLGGGKGKYSVLQIAEYLRAGRPVATNMNLYMEKLVSPRNKMTVMRVPDHPRLEDLQNLGYAYTGKYNTKRNGLLVLDEMGTWFNARNWNDKSRKEIIDFMLHIRKYSWDVIFQVQDISLIDKQLVKATGQLLTNCINLENVPIPIISFFSRVLTGKSIYFPLFHRATTYLGDSKNGYKLEGIFFKADHIHDAYDTRQVFKHDNLIIENEIEVDMRASYCMLSSWHLRGRYIGTVYERILRVLKVPFYLLCNFINLTFTGKPLSAARGFTVKDKSFLVSTIQNEYKPVTFYNDDNVFIFPIDKYGS